MAGVINSAFGCAGQRCMALSCCVVEEDIADAFVEELIQQAKEIKIDLHRKNQQTGAYYLCEAHYKEILWILKKG